MSSKSRDKLFQRKLERAQTKFKLLSEIERERLFEKASLLAEESMANFLKTIDQVAAEKNATKREVERTIEALFGDLSKPMAQNDKFSKMFDLAVMAGLVTVMEEEKLL